MIILFSQREIKRLLLLQQKANLPAAALSGWDYLHYSSENREVNGH